MIRAYLDRQPSIDSTAFIAETAVIIGDVSIGSETSIWYNVVVRGDVNSISIGDRTNVQDLSMLHVTGKRDENDNGSPLVIGNDVTIGHSVIVHGCTIHDRAFIGMGATVLDRCVIGSGAMVAAGSLVPEGTIIPPNTLWMGSPAKFKRELSEKDLLRTAKTTASYVSLSSTYKEITGN